MLIRKSEIVNILNHTPLASGEFINQYGEVCAVGAILKQLVSPGTGEVEFREIAERNAPAAQRPSAKPYLEAGDYLSALSIYFENIMFSYDDVYSEDVKDELLNFVNKYFPEELVVYVQAA